MQKKKIPTTSSTKKDVISIQHIDNIKVMYTNADTLSNKITELRTRVQIEKPQIICVNEVKPKHSKTPPIKEHYSIDNFYMYMCNIGNATGRGIIIYVHSSIKGTIEFTPVTEFTESVWIQIPLHRDDKLLVGCIYRSDSGSNENNNKLHDLISEATNKKFSHLLITGDFNYRHINWGNWTTQRDNNSEEHNFIECIRDNYLHQHIEKPTRGRINCDPSTIDLVLTNEENMATDISHQSPLGKSDHAVITFRFNCYLNLTQKPRSRYQYDSANYNGMREDLNMMNWQQEFNKYRDDVNKQWSTFKEKLKSTCDKHVPKKPACTNPNWKSPTSIPLDKKIVTRIHKNHRAWQRYYETKKPKAICRIRTSS